MRATEGNAATRAWTSLIEPGRPGYYYRAAVGAYIASVIAWLTQDWSIGVLVLLLAVDTAIVAAVAKVWKD